MYTFLLTVNYFWSHSLETVNKTALNNIASIGKNTPNAMLLISILYFCFPNR